MTSKITLFISFILLSTAVSFGKSQYIEVEGTIVNSKGLKTVTLVLPCYGPNKKLDFVSIQKSINKKDSINVTKIYPSEVLEVRFKYRGEKFRFLTQKRPKKFKSKNQNKEIFLRLINNGEIRLYNYYKYSAGIQKNNLHYQDRDTSFEFDITPVFQKINDTPVWISKTSFKNDATLYFEKCPKLGELLNDNLFKKSQVRGIYKYYTDYCN